MTAPTSTTIIVLFNLKPGISIAEYEKFAREHDIPAVNGLPSVVGYEILKAQAVQGGGASPYQYIEIVRVTDMKQFEENMKSPVIQELFDTFLTMVESPQSIVCQDL
ncbi:MAG TPA: hypothetical protein VNM90_14590 [Haliangium sp.]|nr:hypothetical protein [Haliangium sp.]